MATVAYTITSHYDPADREILEKQTGQAPDIDSDGDDSDEAWKAPAAGERQRLQTAPRFVPATAPYDEWGSWERGERQQLDVTSTSTEHADEVVSWYRSLPRRKQHANAVASGSGSGLGSLRGHIPVSGRGSVSAAPPKSQSTSSVRNSPTPVPSPAPRPEARTKNDWFIARALASSAAPARPDPAPAPTLADILARDPPPRTAAGDAPFAPPVFLVLGPANRGFAMLQRDGWSEGEALGPGVVRRRRPREGLGAGAMDADVTLGPPRTRVKIEEREEEHEVAEGVHEVRKLAVIDLTLSDDEDDGDELTAEFDDLDFATPAPAHTSSNADPSASRALLTPLPTVLKSDRLGIGLKAKTEGPYRVSKKRVTHSAAAMAAHIRAGEALQKQKQAVGRGRRGFDRLQRQEETRRRDMIRYLNE